MRQTIGYGLSGADKAMSCVTKMALKNLVSNSLLPKTAVKLRSYNAFSSTVRNREGERT